jgi:hypothetical protein
MRLDWNIWSLRFCQEAAKWPMARIAPVAQIEPQDLLPTIDNIGYIKPTLATTTETT